MNIHLLSLFCCLQICNGFWNFGWKKEVFPNWNKLSVTFGKFNSVPMNEKNAIEAGWTLNKDGCKDSTFFSGKRYALKEDLTTMLLFDSHGQIAGIQMAFSNSFNTAKNWIGGPITDDGKNYHFTVYFTEPKNICNEKKRKTDYIGDKMYIITGENKLMSIPLREDGMKDTKWVKGICFYAMGQHYWYNVSQDMDCNDFFPIFLLYNKHVLNGFGFATASNIVSNRLEHPPKSKLGWFFDHETKPRCLQTMKHLSTQHVYLDKRPYFNFC